MPTNNLAAAGRRAVKRQNKLQRRAGNDEDEEVAEEVTTRTPSAGRRSANVAPTPTPSPNGDRRSGKRRRDEQRDAVTFDDVEDLEYDALGADDESDNEVADADDFETKARKYKKELLRTGRIAEKEATEERARLAPITVLSDLQAAEGDEFETAAGREKSGLLTKPQVSLDELKDRVTETVRVLSQLKDQREEGHSRDEYMALLKTDLIELHEYNEFLMDRVLEMFSPAEAVEFLDAMEKERPVTLRTNTLKAKRRDLVQALLKRGLSVEPLERWSKHGLQVFDSKVHPGATLEYLAGQYMVQAAASFLPVIALDPQEGEKILDMAAAPGGKTTYICQLMKNSGTVVANDPSEARCKSLNANIQRLGITNCIVTNYDGIGYQRVLRHFDRILLDAPCTGTGVISRDKSIKTSKQLEDVQRVGLTQRKLILEAVDCLKPGGVLVYSTCSFLVEEDEAVVDFLLKRRYVEVVDTGLPFGRPGFSKYRQHRYDASIELTRRYFPHVHNLDGFYVAKIIKHRDGVRALEADGHGAKAAAPARRKTTEERRAARRERLAALAAKQKAAVEVATLPGDGTAPETGSTLKTKLSVSVPPSAKRPKARAAGQKPAAQPRKPSAAGNDHQPSAEKHKQPAKESGKAPITVAPAANGRAAAKKAASNGAANPSNGAPKRKRERQE